MLNLIVSSNGEIVVNADRVFRFYVERDKIFDDDCKDYDVLADEVLLSQHKSYDGARSALKKLYNNIANVGGIYQMEDTE